MKDIVGVGRLSVSVVIATRNRPDVLCRTLNTVAEQTFAPMEVVVVDSSDNDRTKLVVEAWCRGVDYLVRYQHSDVCSAARQRNEGIDASSGDVIVFIDDDVDLDCHFLGQLVEPLQEDDLGVIGGVGGTMVNSSYTRPRGINRILLGLLAGDYSGEWAGRVVGPAINFLPEDRPGVLQRVEWLSTTGTAYRKDILRSYRFGEGFQGYSFGEDLHLSTRIAKNYVLLNNSCARYFHHDLGQQTHKDWVSLGESAVVNRFVIMIDVLDRRGFKNVVKFLFSEIVYWSVAAIASSRGNRKRLFQMAKMLAGKVRGCWRIFSNAGAALHG